MRNDQPFVGKSAFAHKGGIHVSAVMKDAATYEHVVPELVGNRQRVLVSDLSGQSNVVYRLRQHGLSDNLPETARRALLARVKDMEHAGYDLEAADGTFELLVHQAMHPDLSFFEVRDWEVSIKSGHATATVHVTTDNGPRSGVATGHGPVHALDVALRKCLAGLYPRIGEVSLTDYKVRVLDANKGTDARVRVLVEWTDHEKNWSTVGVSDDVIEASWNALVDALRLELMRLEAPVVV
jgi:2-isopropylmalate synthase